MQTRQPAGTQQKRQAAQPGAEGDGPSSPFQLQEVPGNSSFTRLMGRWSFLRKPPGKTLWGVRTKADRLQKAVQKEKSLHDTEWDSPVRYLGLKETTINIWLLKSWAWGGGRSVVVVVKVPLLCFIIDTLIMASGKCRLALLWRFIVCGGHFESEVPESLTFPSQVSPCCVCKCQSSFFTAVRTD